MRLQVMYLPDETVGEITRGRFALIVDDYLSGPDLSMGPDQIHEQLSAFAKEIGAAGVGIFADKVEVL